MKQLTRQERLDAVVRKRVLAACNRARSLGELLARLEGDAGLHRRALFTLVGLGWVRRQRDGRYITRPTDARPRAPRRIVQRASRLRRVQSRG